MELTVAVKERVGTVHVAGDVDAQTADELRRCLFTVLEDGASSLVIDCSGVEFMDSAGLSVLLEVSREARAKLGAVTIERPSAMLHRLLQITGLDQELVMDGSPPRA